MTHSHLHVHVYIYYSAYDVITIKYYLHRGSCGDPGGGQGECSPQRCGSPGQRRGRPGEAGASQCDASPLLGGARTKGLAATVASRATQHAQQQQEEQTPGYTVGR